LVLLAPAGAWAQPQNFRTEPDGQVIPLPGRKLDPDCVARPIAQFSTFMGAGIGAATDAGRTLPTGDLRAGGGVTAPLTHVGVLRAGPFLELRGAPQLGYAQGFAELEISRGELPRRLLQERYGRTMDGVVAVRGGVGWSPWRGGLATAVLSYGTRATGETVEGYNYYGHCRGPAEDVIDGRPVGRGVGRCDYAGGIRAFVSGTADRRRDWQIVVGIEVEPFSLPTLLNPPRGV
jgi:hypothetical protein